MLLEVVCAFLVLDTLCLVSVQVALNSNLYYCFVFVNSFFNYLSKFPQAFRFFSFYILRHVKAFLFEQLIILHV